MSQFKSVLHEFGEAFFPAVMSHLPNVKELPPPVRAMVLQFFGDGALARFHAMVDSMSAEMQQTIYKVAKRLVDAYESENHSNAG
ncbi:MAG: hypothetical protein IRZ03_18905 [Acidobacterium ailaaui]|nr:hypothetical protein [Pseudacidobacterium ailaaui]